MKLLYLLHDTVLSYTALHYDVVMRHAVSQHSYQLIFQCMC